MSADGAQTMPGGISPEAMRLQQMLEQAERRGEEKGRQREEQQNLTQRMTSVEMDLRETKNCVQKIETMLAAYFGTNQPSQQSVQTPAQVAQSSVGGSIGFGGKLADLAKLGLYAIIALSGAVICLAGGPVFASYVAKMAAGG
jgi:hypothetical protein